MVSYGSGAGSDGFVWAVTERIDEVRAAAPATRDQLDNGKLYVELRHLRQAARQDPHGRVRGETMRDVAIVGVGLSRWGEVWDASLRTLWTEAALAALDDAGLDRVDAITVGSMTPGLFVGQEHLGALLADELGMAGVPATRVESACASGGVALKAGFAEVAAGLADIVLVTGVEKMTDVSGDECTAALAAAADAELEVFYGATFPGLYAMMARAHMARWGTTREQLAMVAVKNHRHGALNPHAQYRQEITVKDVIESAKVAEPLTILDCSPITDGAAARGVGGDGSGAHDGEGAPDRPDRRRRPGHRPHRPPVARRPDDAAGHHARSPARVQDGRQDPERRSSRRGPRLLHHCRDRGGRGPRALQAG